MHDHNKNSGHKGMMWMMIICCLLPVIVLFGGIEFFKSIGYSWIGIALVGIFILMYLFRMWRTNQDHNSNSQNVDNEKNKDSHNNCCH